MKYKWNYNQGVSMIGDLFFVGMGVVCFFIGWGFCKMFGCRRKKKDEPCETLQDVIDREG